MSDYTPYIEQIARAALGEPNGKLSSARELRFGTHGSKSVVLQGEKAGAYYDHENGTGGGPVELVRDALGLDFNEAMKWLDRETGIERQGGNGAYIEPVVRKKPNGSPPIETVYPYRDGDSVIRYEIVRKPNHKFVGRHTDENGKIIRNIEGVERLPYRLPELMIRCAESIFIAEGEKDVDRLAANGLLATCNPFGANNWRKAEINQYFVGRDIFILPDNDPPGRRHAEEVRAELAPVANRVDAFPQLCPRRCTSFFHYKTQRVYT